MSPSLFEVTGLGPRQGPMSIEDIISEAENMLGGYNPNIPLRFYLRSADAINKQAQAYERHGNEEEAFKFYYRHAILITKNLSKHPDVLALNTLFRQRSNVKTLEQQQHMAAWRKAKQDVELNVDRMEIMKPHIKRRYEAFQQAQARRKAEEDKLTQVERNNTYRALVGGAESISAASGRSSYGYGRTQQLDPTISSDLAVKLAHNEFRGAAFREAASDSRSPSIKSTSRSQKGLSHRGTFFSDDSDDDLSEQMMAVAQRREQAFARPESQESKDSKQHRTSSTNRAPKYPTIPKQIVQTDSTWYGDGSDSIPPPAISRSEIHSPSPAPIQPLTSDPHTIFHSPSPPPIRPPKEQLYASESPPPLPAKVRSPSPVEAPDTAVVDPRNYTFLTLATTESGRLLRTLFINPKVRSEFQNIALANTQRNLETCGILCGRLVSNAFFVSKLVIPEQESTSDTCDTVNEGALFDYCDSENLMTLGWIHTHPTQTCFLSSRDLHTHSGYQVQLAESIAIVCAPRHQPSWGVFRLTDPPGLGAVLNCKQTGIFHPHEEQNLYTDALLPGHVKEVKNLPFDIVDLRPDTSWI